MLCYATLCYIILYIFFLFSCKQNKRENKISQVKEKKKNKWKIYLLRVPSIIVNHIIITNDARGSNPIALNSVRGGGGKEKEKEKENKKFLNTFLVFSN